MNSAKVRGARFNPAAGVYIPSISPFFGLLPRELWALDKDFFSYNVSFLPLNAGITDTRNVTVQADSDFLCVAINGAVFSTAATPVVVANGAVPATIFIQDTTSGRNFSSSADDWNNICGTGAQPGYLPFPKRVRANSTLTIQVANLDTANNRNFRVSLIGFKIFLR